MQDKQFDEDLNDTERNAWLSFKRICKDFLGNHKVANYPHVVQDLLTSYKGIGCNMILKLHFLESHLDLFPENLGEVGDEQVKDFTQTLWLWKNGTKAVGPQVCWQTSAGFWRGMNQILAKFISLYILEESFCLFHEYMKYYFARLKSSVSLKPCLIEIFCIHIWIQHKKYC